MSWRHVGATRAHLSFQITDCYRGCFCLTGADVNETGGEKWWQAECDSSDAGITVVLSTVGNGR